MDVGKNNFQEAVIARSSSIPVVVDFWAEWCAPCRMLGPIIESEVAALGGRVALAKVNTETDPELAQQYDIRGIPAVKGFRNGQVVAEFVGARPAAAVREWLAALAPSPAEEALSRAMAAAESGQWADAEAILRPLLGEESSGVSDRAALALARVLLDSGRPEEVEALLDRIDPRSDAVLKVPSLRRRVDFFRDAEAFGGAAAAEAALQRNPRDLEARYALASAQAARGDLAAALESFLEVVARDRKLKNDGARLAMLSLFEQLGPDNDLARDMRRRLQVVL